MLAHLLPLDKLMGLLVEKDLQPGHVTIFAEGFRRFVLPYLTPEQRASCIARVRPFLAKSAVPGTFYHPFDIAAYLGAALGLSSEIQQLLAGCADSCYAGQAWSDHYQQPQWLVFGLGNPAAVQSEFQRLGIRLRNARQVRAWLAHTEFSGFGPLHDSIQAAGNREEAEELTETFARVEAPEAAEPMLSLRMTSKAATLARDWLNQHPKTAILGLLETAAGRGKKAEAALEFLHEKKQQGFEPWIRHALDGIPAPTAEYLRRDVLAVEVRTLEPLDPAELPEALRDALAAVVLPKKFALPAWLEADKLPPLVVAGKRLDDTAVQKLLAVLQPRIVTLPLEWPPLVLALKQHADRASLSAFVWKLFEQWRSDGAPSKDKWALLAVGYLGDDAAALKLTPLIRAWPGESQHQRAVLGLVCLRTIGTDTALMQLNGVAQKLPFKALKTKAAKLMEQIAHDRKLTRAQLEDRIVPDCDLDQRGRRTFDFGPRQFAFVLGPDLKPLLRDESGKLRDDLPKPGAKDDEAKSTEAVAAWKLLKKQIREVAKLQAQRLEQALITGRTWTAEEFQTLLVRHPLMGHLTRGLLWAAVDAEGRFQPFRVTDEQDYADQDDQPFQLQGSVRLVHPLHLDEARKSAWGEVFSDYALQPPFQQLGRPVFRLTPEEAEQTHLKRLDGLSIPAFSLVGTLERLGWNRGIPEDAGVFYEHSKPFEAANVTAVLLYDPGIPIGALDMLGDQKVTDCFFIGGTYQPEMYPRHADKYRLARIDAVCLSEVLADLEQLAAKSV